MSIELGRPLAGPGRGTQTAMHEAEAHPSMAVYLLTGLATFVITAIEILIINYEGFKPILVPLLAVNFGIAALFYQGLWYEHVMYKLIFGVGLLLGVITLVGLMVMLPLGTIVH